VRHVVGRFELVSVGDVVPGDALSRASNRVRAALRSAAASAMAQDDATLFTGLVVGDDGLQPTWMVDDFRASGLSHLTAVSGQNVAYLLAAALPILRRLRPLWRWAATVGLVGWFMALTRFEPSVLRAGVMAGLAATAFVLGRQPHPLRLLALAVIGLALADPLLVWSVGFWLSVCATAGLCAVTPLLVDRLPGPHWLRLAAAVTLGAQAGVAIPSVLVFHRLPVVAVPANLAAVPVAGFVMLYGLPAGLAAAALPRWLAAPVMLPAVVGTRWVRTVAQLAATLEPSPTWAVAGWAAGGALLVLHLARRSRRATPPVPS
jgi:competence protein ComEC